MHTSSQHMCCSAHAQDRSSRAEFWQAVKAAPPDLKHSIWNASAGITFLTTEMCIVPCKQKCSYTYRAVPSSVLILLDGTKIWFRFQEGSQTIAASERLRSSMVALALHCNELEWFSSFRVMCRGNEGFPILCSKQTFASLCLHACIYSSLWNSVAHASCDCRW